MKTLRRVIINNIEAVKWQFLSRLKSRVNVILNEEKAKLHVAPDRVHYEVRADLMVVVLYAESFEDSRFMEVQVDEMGGVNIFYSVPPLGPEELANIKGRIQKLFKGEEGRDTPPLPEHIRTHTV